MISQSVKLNNIAPERVFWLDNLRTFMIFLVVVYHAAIIYEKSGMGYQWWIVTEPASSDLPGILVLLLDIFIMPTVFLVAGYFSHRSLENKPALEFINARFKRLIVPWVIAVLTLIPLYKVIYLYSHGFPQEHWASYFHWSNGIWSQNWLWFLPVLFAFEVLYLGLAKSPFAKQTFSFGRVFAGSIGVGLIYCFSMDYLGMQGWTKTPFMDFQNERLLVYFLAFFLGASCYTQNTFAGSINRKLAMAVHTLGWLPITGYLFFVIYGIIKPYDFLVSNLIDTLIEQTCFLLSMNYFVYSMISLFRRFFNNSNRLTDEMNRNSYGVYIIHVVVMGVIATLLVLVQMPVLLKFGLTVLVTFVIGNLCVAMYKRTAMMISLASNGIHRRPEVSIR